MFSILVTQLLINILRFSYFLKGFRRIKEFIATQGPRPKSIDDFWRLVWQEKSSNIVMLTQLKEQGIEGKQLNLLILSV